MLFKKHFLIIFFLIIIFHKKNKHLKKLFKLDVVKKIKVFGAFLKCCKMFDVETNALN